MQLNFGVYFEEFFYKKSVNRFIQTLKLKNEIIEKFGNR